MDDLLDVSDAVAFALALRADTAPCVSWLSGRDGGRGTAGAEAGTAVVVAVTRGAGGNGSVGSSALFRTGSGDREELAAVISDPGAGPAVAEEEAAAFNPAKIRIASLPPIET